MQSGMKVASAAASPRRPRRTRAPTKAAYTNANTASPTRSQPHHGMAERYAPREPGGGLVDVDQSDDAADHDGVQEQPDNGDLVVGIALARARVSGQRWQHADQHRKGRDGHADRDQRGS